MLHASEIRTVTDTSIRVQELRVIESVEELGAELNPLTLGDGRDLLQGEIEVVDSWAAAESTRRSSQRAQRCVGK